MLVTLCWQQFLSIGDRISTVAKSFECWCSTPMLKYRWCWWRKWPKPSPTSQSCRQHISSPTFVTNIDVALEIRWWISRFLVRIWIWVVVRKLSSWITAISIFKPLIIVAKISFYMYRTRLEDLEMQILNFCITKINFVQFVNSWIWTNYETIL